jgi:hypothetical protein
MPSVMDTPEMIEYVETHDLTIETLEQPQPRRVRPGFWRTLAHTIAGDCTPTHQQYASSCQAHRPFETPADQLARQYPTLYLRAYCGV